MGQSGDTLVLSLAELLGGKQVGTGVIDKALASLCAAFDFDGGSMNWTSIIICI